MNTISHPLKIGERHTINNVGMRNGKPEPFVEGAATIISPMRSPDWYRVRFDNGDDVDRFIDPASKAF